MSPDVVAMLVRIGRTEVIERDHILLEEGRPSNTLYFVHSGQLVVRTGDGTELARVGDGAMVGEVSFLDGGSASATVVASTPATVLAIDRAAFEVLGTEAPATAAALIREVSVALSARIRRSSDMLEVLSGPSAHPAPYRTWIDVLRALFGWRAS